MHMLCKVVYDLCKTLLKLCKLGELGTGHAERERMWKVYLLHCPVTGEPRYVGCTSLRLEERLSQHCGPGRAALQRWARGLGKRPGVSVIATFPAGQRQSALGLEKDVTRALAAAGVPLFNVRNTGRPIARLVQGGAQVVHPGLHDLCKFTNG